VGLFKRILYFLLSFLLTIQSQGVAFLLMSSAYADEFDKQRDDCINKKSKVWDPALNRCMTKAESFENRQSFRQCESIKDDAAKQRQCFDDNASEMIGSLEVKKAGLKEMQKTAEAMGYIQMIIEMIAKEGANAKCMSSKVMAISGIVGMGVDIYLTFFVEDELHNLQDKYAKSITKKKQIEKGTYEAQIEAFNYLQKEQETLISVDEKKIIAYGLMTGLNGVAMLLAIYEMTPFGAAGACTAESPPGEGVDVPESKVADVDAGKKGAPDVEVPEGPPEGPGPKGPEGPGPGPEGGGKKGRFKEVATDVKTKKKVIDAFPDGGKGGPGGPPSPPTPPTKPEVPGGGVKGKFKQAAGDVKKMLGGIPDLPPPKPREPPVPPRRPNILDNPPGDISPPPKSPGEPPKKPASLALGDRPSPPTKPDILNNPPGGVPAPPKDPGKPPKAPEPPGDPPRNPGDPGNPPPKPSAKAPKDPGDLPPAAPPGKPPPDPGLPPKDIDLEGGPSKAVAKAPEPPVPPVEPVKPAGGPGKTAGGGDYIEANIESTKTKQKPLKELSDTDIDSMQLTRDQKQTMKNNKAKLAEIDSNIRVKKKKFGADVDVSEFQKQKARIEKQSADFQNKSEIQQMAGGRTKKGAVDADMENYNKQKAKYDADLDSYKQKKAEYDSYQGGQGQRLGADTKQRAAIDNYKTKKAEFDNYQKQKIDYENYKSQKAEFDNYKKQKADYDSYGQKKADFDGYASESQSWKQKNQKYQADLEGFNQKQTKYEGDLAKYDQDYDTWKNQKSTSESGSADFDAAKSKYDDDLATYETDMDSWTKQKKKAELDRANYNSKKAKYDTDMETYQKDYDNWASKKSGNAEFENAKKKYDSDLAKFDADMDDWTKQNKKYDTDLAEYKAKKEVFADTPVSPLEPPKMTKTDPGPPPAPPKRPDILEKPPGDIPPPPKKPVDPGGFDMVYTDPPDLPPSKVADFNQYGDFPRGGKAPELPSEPPIPPKGAADPGSPPPKNSPDYQKWEVRKEKFEARKKAVPEFNEKYKQWEADAAQYRADVKKYRAEVEDFKQNLPPAKRRELDGYTADLDAHNSRISKTDKDLHDFDKKWVKYENEMDNYKKQKYEWENNYKDKGTADFDAKQKKYEQDMAKYEADYESWSNKKSEFDSDQTNFAKKKKEYDAEVSKDTDFVITAEDKASFYEWAKTKIPEEGAPKKSFKEAAGEVGTKKKVIDAFEKPPEEPVAPTPEKPKKSFKDIAGEVKEEKKVIDAFEKPPEKPVTPEPPKSTWESFKDGASNLWNWFKGSSVKTGAKMGTKIIHNKVMFYKGGKEVEYCDKDLEDDCEEKVVPEGPAAPPTEERERSKVKENPDSSYRKVKDINFNDPNEILSAFINHKFEDKGLENIEDALILDKEWKSKVSGGIKSPSIVEYKKMQESGLFGKNPLMANIIYNIAISYRKINLANSLFPVAQAQDSTTSPDTTTTPSTSGAVSDKPKNTFEEETDDEEDKAAKAERNKQKGKDAGIMVGSAGAGMIGGALISAGLDKFTPMLGKLGKVVDKVRVFFGTSPGIAVLAGMSTLINGLTLGFVVEEKKAFGENVDKIKDIKSKFEEDMAEHCPAAKDRETQSKPQCYCYISGGQRNPLRRNSDICKSYYARFDGSFYVGAGSYEFKADSPVKGCVGVKGNYDVDCSCRKYKDRSSGSNACMKVNNNFEGIGNIGSSNSVGVLTTYGNDIASDPATIHRLDGEAVGRNAVKMKQASDQAMLAFNKQRVANGEKPFSVGGKELESFTNKVMSLPESRGAIAALQEAKTAPVRPPMAMPKDLKLKEEKKMDLSKITYESTAKKKEEKKEEAKAKAPDWDFLGEKEKEKEDVNFMGKSFDYEKGVKKKQIVEKEDTNIFNIISNRYINTGLKLLFKEDK
jgi:hypothetical protein